VGRQNLGQQSDFDAGRWRKRLKMERDCLAEAVFNQLLEQDVMRFILASKARCASGMEHSATGLLCASLAEAADLIGFYFHHERHRKARLPQGLRPRNEGTPPQE
jgi:hypothetical protein